MFLVTGNAGIVVGKLLTFVNKTRNSAKKTAILKFQHCFYYLDHLLLFSNINPRPPKGVVKFLTTFVDNRRF